MLNNEVLGFSVLQHFNSWQQFAVFQQSRRSSDFVDFYETSGDMDDIYEIELLRQSLVDTREREEGLTLRLEAAQKEVQESQRHAIGFKRRAQELDDALEAEESKTNDERLAREKAEETAHQHHVDVLKARRNEKIANEHCEAAETEIVQFQKDLATERSATAAAGQLSTRLREDLKQAEINEMTAFDFLDAAKDKTSALQDDLGVATDRIRMLELRARRFEKNFRREHRRVVEAEKTLSAIVYELKSNQARLGDILEKHNALKARYDECNSAKSKTTIAFHSQKLDVIENSPVDAENKNAPISKQGCEQVVKNDGDLEETTTVKAPLNTANDLPMGMPSPPKPAILRPTKASVTAGQVEVFKATGKRFPAPKTETRHLRWKFYWRLPLNSLQALFRGDDLY